MTTRTCQCGCGRPVTGSNRFLHGHSGHKWSSRTGRAARARVRPQERLVDPFPEDVIELAKLAALTRG